ncbi:MAG TPA: GTP cyclohydrolase MptA [Thermoplasmata archaeon]|nr:GTP cyclohydrolase MptA [Thermoplasmata archaeon]
MKDVHAMAPASGSLDLRHVGIESVQKPLTVRRGDRVLTLTVTFSVTVDLPASRKGSDLSRNAEVLAELVDRTATHPVPSLESACSEIARELLARHPYAKRSSVRARAVYFLPRGLSSGRSSLEDFGLLAEADAERDGEGPPRVHRAVGAEAVGMTACPCAMESTRELLRAEYPDVPASVWASVPVVTHNQRNRTRLTFHLDDSTEVEADDIIGAIEAAESSPTYAILKRGDEARMVLQAHRAPKFVEDVLRDLLASLPSRFPGLPDGAEVTAESTSEESIHKYNVVASHRATMGQLRQRPND